MNRARLARIVGGPQLSANWLVWAPICAFESHLGAGANLHRRVAERAELSEMSERKQVDSGIGGQVATV